MNLDDLSNGQLLLLTVMVNFVVSIATGVLTVSMLDSAPQTVTQTVDRIVDHTIQTISAPIQVATVPIIKPSQPSEPAAPTTEQQLTAALSADAAHTVLIYKGATSTPAIAFGTYLPKSGAVVTANVVGLPKEATIQFADGSTASASFSKSSASLYIYGFGDGAALPGVAAATLASSADLKQGQTVAALTKDSAAVTGIISKVADTGIQTDLAGVPAGAGVVNLSGEFVGVGSATAGLVIPSDSISALLAAPAATKK